MGESGAGKVDDRQGVLGTLPRAMIVTGGEILLDGEDLLDLTPTQRRQRDRRENRALIPQDPLTALNPSRRVGAQITNRLVDILGWSKSARPDTARWSLLGEVQINDPERVMLRLSARIVRRHASASADRQQRSPPNRG